MFPAQRAKTTQKIAVQGEKSHGGFKLFQRFETRWNSWEVSKTPVGLHDYIEYPQRPKKNWL